MATDLAAVRIMLLGGLPLEAYDITVEVFPAKEASSEDSERADSPSTGGSPSSVRDAA